VSAAHQKTRYVPGDRVQVAADGVAGHCRAPWYLRGQKGIVTEVLGIFRDPERLAYLKPGLPRQVLYKVRFQQSDLWPNYQGPAGDQLEADIAENRLASVAPFDGCADTEMVPHS
jgi:nitrile hydratase subunit beta